MPKFTILAMTCLIKHVFQTKQKNKSKCLQHDYRNRTLTNHISCECKCKCDGRKCISSQIGAAINADVSVKIPKNIMCAKKIVFGMPLHADAKMKNI